jgi:dihydroflavonol-4-reductase
MNSELKIGKGSRVLITGATGFTGAVLLRKLVAMGASVRAIARPTSSLSQFEALPVEWIRGEVYDPAVIAQATENIEFIFHVAAAFRQAKIADEEYSKVHCESTELLANAVCGSKVFKRLIHVSTMGVHGHIETPPGDESSPFAPGDLYQITKAKAELWLKDFAAAHSIPYTIIRPTGIFGPGDRRLLKVFKMATMPFFPMLGSGNCLYHLIHVEDLTDAMLRAAVAESALGEAFIIGNDRAIGLIDTVKIVSNVLGTNPRPVRIPAWPFFMLAAVCEAVCRPFGIEPPLYRRRVAFFTKDRSFDTSKMRSVLGFTPRYSNEEGIIQTAQWYVREGWLSSRKRGSVEVAPS